MMRFGLSRGQKPRRVAVRDRITAEPTPLGRLVVAWVNVDPDARWEVRLAFADLVEACDEMQRQKREAELTEAMIARAVNIAKTGSRPKLDEVR